ncbi:MAG: hypothetical protein U9Q22_05925 [Candidatus Altiarchaeota archaeon]|nr:hypothetical protein [Candidatus Altiarchaeota archaeon]
MDDFIRKVLQVAMLVMVTTSLVVGLEWEPVLIVGGGRGDEDGELYEPVDVTVDVNGSIYVLERYNERIQKFDVNGVFKEIYGEAGSSGPGEFDGPGGIAIREVNATITQLFIADTDNHRIQVMTNELRTTEDNDTILNTTWQAFGERCYGDCVSWVYIYFEEPGGVDVDDSGRIYVADTGNNRISIIYDLPANLSKYPTPHNRTDLNGFNEPKAVSVRDDRIYVADTGNNQVKILNLTGSEINSIDGLNKPSSIALDSVGNIYVADSLNSRIMIFNPQGLYLTEFGEENCSVHIYNDPEAAVGQFCMPEGIEIRGEKIYVADTGNHRIQVFETRELPLPTCPLAGDYDPCGEVILEEVVDYMVLWGQGQAEVGDVVALINAWAWG